MNYSETDKHKKSCSCCNTVNPAWVRFSDAGVDDCGADDAERDAALALFEEALAETLGVGVGVGVLPEYLLGAGDELVEREGHQLPEFFLGLQVCVGQQLPFS